MQLENTRCLLTGASGGIGRAVALQLAANGVSLVLSGRNLAALTELSAEIGLSGGKAEVVQSDLRKPHGAQELITDTLALNARLDMLINCAGVSDFNTFENTPTDQLDAIMQTNVLAPMRLTQAAIPALRLRDSAMIVNVGSIFGSIGFPCFAAYSASKFALRGFSEALRRELSDSAIKVLYFAPRYTRTMINDARVAAMASAVKMHQDEPDAVAAALVKAIRGDRRDRYMGWPEKLFVRLNALFPALLDGALIKQDNQMRPYSLERLV